MSPGGIGLQSQRRLTTVPAGTQAHQVDLVDSTDGEDAVLIWLDEIVRSAALDSDLTLGDPTLRIDDAALTGLAGARIADPGQQRADGRPRAATRPDIIILWTRSAGADQEIHAHLFDSEQ